MSFLKNNDFGKELSCLTLEVAPSNIPYFVFPVSWEQIKLQFGWQLPVLGVIQIIPLLTLFWLCLLSPGSRLISNLCSGLYRAHTFGWKYWSIIKYFYCRPCRTWALKILFTYFIEFAVLYFIPYSHWLGEEFLGFVLLTALGKVFAL